MKILFFHCTMPDSSAVPKAGPHFDAQSAQKGQSVGVNKGRPSLSCGEMKAFVLRFGFPGSAGGKDHKEPIIADVMNMG